MNEYSILFYLLSKRIAIPNLSNYPQLGETEERICESLKYTGKAAHIRFLSLIEEFSRNISPFGLIIRKNPFNNHWFLTQSSEIQNFFLANPFDNKNRLAATLCIIITFALSESNSIPINKIKEIRKKKEILNDLHQLEELHFIILKENKIKIHPNLGYYLDFEGFLESLDKNSKIFSNKP